MKQTNQSSFEVPVWAREDAFPEAPSGWGWTDSKGVQHPCNTRDALTAAIRDDPNGNITLVWTPDQPRMLLPEELDGMSDALRTARDRWTREDLADANHKLRWFGAILIGIIGYSFLRGLMWAGAIAMKSGVTIDFSQRFKLAASVVLNSFHSGIALLMFLIFAFIPWYQARKRRAELKNWTTAKIAEIAPTIRFETWLERQKAPLTKFFLGLMILVAVAQISSGFKSGGGISFSHLLTQWGGTKAAGLEKVNGAPGDWWRLFTAPFLHGNILHFLMNASALLYLGKRIEVFARWPHLPLVFLFAACVGGAASARFVAAPSVGASGGLMGWLGFLLVFETLHRQLVPRRATRRLAAGVVVTAL
ncbi:MAG: rhomboid family intramembrane serine protease, partial [Akkermansiaceae bacterium]|nr:rhomboid family intramembrane serine protease [Akkermansiaceae bacterium]